MSASLTELIHPFQPYAQALYDLAGRAGVQPRITSTLRSHSLQQRLYDQFLRGETQYPVAPPGKSAHEYGFAFDMVAATREDLHDLGEVWRSWGGLWSPDDEVHFQFPGFNPNSVHDPLASGCDLADWRNWILWSPECACRVVDFLKGSIVSSLLELGWPENSVLNLLSHPCTSILEEITKLGL